MAIDRGLVRHNKAFFLALFLLAFASSLFAQVEVRFIQHLAWNKDDNTLRYEVIIEREQNGQYTGQLRDFTAVPWIDVTLPPGNYRYRVIPYNLINRPGEGSQWTYIVVRPALRPGVNYGSSDVLYLDEREEYVLNVSGTNIEPDAAIELRRSDGVSIVPYAKKVASDGSSVDLLFSRRLLIPGTYVVYIRNLSGLETSGGTISIAYPEVEPAAPESTESEDSAIPEPAQEEKEPAPSIFKGRPRLNTLGVSLGTTFIAPLFLATLHGTFAPWSYSFLEIGVDVGLGGYNKEVDIDYFSVYPFIHYSAFLPFTEKFGIYAGAGAGFMIARYTFPEGDVWPITLAIDVIAGFNILNFLDVSYTLRIGVYRTDIGEAVSKEGRNHKLSVGYVYRFK